MKYENMGTASGIIEKFCGRQRDFANRIACALNTLLKGDYWHAALIAIAIAGIYFRARNLGSVVIAYGEEPVIFSDSAFLESNGALHHLIVFWFKSLCGPSVFVCRLPSVLFGIGSGILLFFIGKMLAGRNAGLFSLFFWSVNGHLYSFEKYCRFYAAGEFFTLLSVFLLIALLKAAGKKSRPPVIFCILLLYILSAVLSVCSMILSILVIAGELLFVAFKLRNWLYKLLIIASCSMPVYYVFALLRRYDADALSRVNYADITYKSFLNIPAYLCGISCGEYLDKPFLSWIFISLLIFLVIKYLLFCKKSQYSIVSLLLFCAILPVVALIAYSLLIKNIYQLDNLFLQVPFAVLIMGVIMSKASHGWRIFILVLIGLFSGFLIQPDISIDCRERCIMYKEIRERGREGDMLIENAGYRKRLSRMVGLPSAEGAGDSKSVLWLNNNMLKAFPGYINSITARSRIIWADDLEGMDELVRQVLANHSFESRAYLIEAKNKHDHDNGDNSRIRYYMIVINKTE